VFAAELGFAMITLAGGGLSGGDNFLDAGVSSVHSGRPTPRLLMLIPAALGSGARLWKFQPLADRPDTTVNLAARMKSLSVSPSILCVNVGHFRFAPGRQNVHG